ncbi:helix-turn-helix domain-containing protein [Microvirga antarctica]|uniref:helix-turn-helix domain-containing protein n=1 Tax=Microvirga antarctica TaxID=2819233 RepID=UPI001B3100A5|nr:helix-turn-helix transcriptional regulator [Microvirga antarctica]
MTREQFKSWRNHMGLTQQAAADALGISKGSVDLYERGRRREDERPVVVPKTVELACAALALGITEYQGAEKI